MDKRINERKNIILELFKDPKFVPMKDEMDYLDLYINIQKLRFRESLEIDIEKDPGLDDIMVPFNFLQPLVENAFKHGLSLERDEDKKLRIKAVRNGDWAEIYVANNGVICYGYMGEIYAHHVGEKPKKVHVCSVIAVPEGLDVVKSVLPEDSTIWCAAVDPGMNEHKYIVPGFGDCGDLCYGEKL